MKKSLAVAATIVGFSVSLATAQMTPGSGMGGGQGQQAPGGGMMGGGWGWGMNSGWLLAVIIAVLVVLGIAFLMKRK